MNSILLNPINLNASNLTSNAATLNWTPGSTDTLWNFHWDISNLNSHPIFGNGTTVYGLFNFKKEGKDPKIQAIRHVIRPSISYNINPAFDQYYDSFEVIDADGTTKEEYTRFQGSIFGTPNQNFSSSLGISVGNNFEAKVRDYLAQQ